MNALETIRDTANSKATTQGDNLLAGKFSLAEDTDINNITVTDAPLGLIWLGPNQSSNDTDDNQGCEQQMTQEVKVWVVGETESLWELIMDCHRAILGIQVNQYLTPIVHSSGFLKEINGVISWYELSYHFSVQIRSE